MRQIDKLKFFSKIGYQPHPKQRLYHESTKRFKSAVCGRRFGKSVMCARDMEPQLFMPNKRFWLVGPTYDLGEKEFRVLWDDLLIGLKLGDTNVDGVKTKSSYNKRTGDMYIEFPWQTRVEVRTAAYSKEKNLVGEGLDGVIMCEAAKHDEETWNRFVRPALADKHGWATFVTTPEGYNWLYQVWRLGKDPLYPDYDAWRFPSWENTVIFPGGRDDPEIKLLEQTLSKEEFEQEVAALFTATTGRIYPEFDEEVHVRPYEFNPAWPNYMAFDWGFASSPLAAIEFQVSPSDDIYIWREYYRFNEILEDAFKSLAKRNQPPGYHLDMCFGDAEDPEAVARCNALFAACVAMPEAKQNWRQGIALVKRFLTPRQVGSDEYGRPVERPKLLVSTECPTITREFTQYKRRDHKLDLVESTKAGVAHKKNDDGVDAIRYALMHLFELGAQHHLTELTDINPLIAPNEEFPVLAESGFFTSGMQF